MLPHYHGAAARISPQGWREAAGVVGPVQSLVTRLLVSVKALLEGLTLWSTSLMTENEISDIFVRLGNELGEVQQCFEGWHVDASALQGVEDRLRAPLEECLGQDASPGALDHYLPTIRSVVTDLLMGLRTMQQRYVLQLSGDA